jgi:hypothetical protein
MAALHNTGDFLLRMLNGGVSIRQACAPPAVLMLRCNRSWLLMNQDNLIKDTPPRVTSTVNAIEKVCSAHPNSIY